MSKLSVSEIKAVAEAAITAKHALDAAKAALDADPENADLKAAYDQAAQTATDAQAKADALSQSDTPDPDKLVKGKKIKRRIGILKNQLKEIGLDDEDDEDNDDDDEDDDDRPATIGDLRRLRQTEARETAEQMVSQVEDPIAQKAIKDALKFVTPSGDAERDFKNAVAIASTEKNSKVLEELTRNPIRPSFPSGAGAPPRPVAAEFEPTAEEARFMKPPFNLTKEDILKARG